MIKILIVSLFIISTHVWAASPEELICNAIKDKVLAEQPPYQICGDVIRNFEQYDSQIFITTCNQVMARMASTVGSGEVDYCKEQFKPVTNTESTAGDEIVRVAVDATSPIPQEPVTVASSAMDKCQESDLSSITCPLPTEFVLPDMNSILKSPVFNQYGVSRRTPAVYTFDKCFCFEKSVSKSFTFDKRLKFEEDLEKEKKRVNDLIFNAAGKKIINAFAANLEDINFYKTNNVQAIGGDQMANDLQCTDAADFKSVIMEKCNKNKINADVIRGRTESLLGAFGDFKNAKTIEEKFKQLQEEVLNAKLDPSKLVPGGPQSYSRREYDKTRFGIYQKRDEVKFMSEITDAVMDDPELSKIIDTEMESGKRPGHAIFKLVSDESNLKVRNILSRIASKHHNQGFYKNLSVVLKTENTEDLHNFMMGTYDLAADMHPGLKAIFRSPELFKKTHAQMEKRNGHDLIAELDRDPELLKTFFAKRCEGIKTQFSEALCYPNNNLIELANKEDLNKLLSSVSEQISPVMKDALLCRMQDNDKDNGSIFTRLAFNMGDKLMMADYFKRKANVKDGPSSRFEIFAQAFTGGGNASQFLNDMAEYRSDLRKPSAEFTTIDQALANKKFEELNQPAQIQPLEKIADQPQVNQSFTNNYTASSTATVSTDKDLPVPPKEQKDPRSMLRDFLADEENKSDVEKHLSNLSSKDQEELARLKEELAQDKEKILALLQESERLKLKGYEEKLSEAEAKLIQPQSTSKTAAARKNSNDSDNEEDQESATSQTQFSASSGAPAVNEVKTSSSGSSSSSSVPSNGRGSAGVQRSLASLNSSLASATNNGVTPSAAGISGKGEIIIQSSGSEDVSKEVISFVQKNEPDVETLKQLKSSGMTFKYKVIQDGVQVEKEIKVNYASLSKEAKQFLDQKIAVKEAKRNYSYNTLRLMLGLKAQKQL